MTTSRDVLENKLHDSNTAPESVPLDFLKAITCDFSTELELGRGGYGVVYKGVCSRGKIIAVKDLFDVHLPDKETLQDELNYLMMIKHQHVVQFIGYCAESSWETIKEQSGNFIWVERPKMLLCFEYAWNKSLDKHISDESTGLEWKMRYDIIKGICSGLNFLHEECHIVHLNLKPENILMDATMTPKIADFGFSRMFHNTFNRFGTLGYMAPEYLIQGLISTKADMFSLGVLIIEIMTGGRDYPNVTSCQHFTEEVLGRWRNKFESTSKCISMKKFNQQVKQCVAIALKCVDLDMVKRPTAKDIVQVLNAVDQMEACEELSSEMQCEDNSVARDTTVSKHLANLSIPKDMPNNDTDGKVVVEATSSQGLTIDQLQMDLEDNRTHDLLKEMLLDENARPTPLSFSLLEDITNHFSPFNEIGRGGFAVVYEGMVGKGRVAVKKLTRTHDLPESKFHKEVECLVKAKHRNIVRFLGYCVETKGEIGDCDGKFVMSDLRNWLLCFEYLPNGSLEKYITDASSGLEWTQRFRIIKGICEGLHYLHMNRILHLDLKPSNILLDTHMVPKIADFGLSKCLDENKTHATTTIHMSGTLGYMAPEILHRGKITFATDIFSLGGIILEILTGAKGYPEDENVIESWMNRLEESNQLEQVRVCTKIGMHCMEIDPKKRPVVRYILDMLEKTASAEETAIRRSLAGQSDREAGN